jgi:hypothetical protein
MQRASFGIAFAAVAALGACSSSDDAGTPLTTAAGDVPVSRAETLFPGPEQNLYETTLGIDPLHPDTLVVFATDLSVSNQTPDTCCADRLFRSTDGGATWSDLGVMRHPLEPDYILGADPSMTFDRKGIAHFVHLFRPANEFRYIYAFRSTDGGATWEPPVVAFQPERSADGIHCNSVDKEWVTPGAGDDELLMVYTGTRFRCALGEEPTGLGVLAAVEDVGIYLKRSYDSGRSWTPAQKVWNGYALGAIAQAAPDGTLFLALWGIVGTTTIACPELILGDVFEPHEGKYFSAIILGSSTDDGATWNFHQQSQCSYGDGETPGVGKPGDFGGGNSLPALAIDATTGTAYVAYPNLSLAENRFSIQLIRSTDRGASWSAPATVIASAEEDSRMPAILADAGNVWVAYVATRDDASADTRLLRSADGGASWSAPLTLTSAPSHLDANPQVRDYLGFDRVGERLAVSWTDARDGVPTTIRAWTGSTKMP